MKVVYSLKTDYLYDEDGNLHTVYGIAASDMCGRVMASCSDVFFDKAKAEDFIELCNREELSLIHLEDVIEDVLAEQYSSKA